MFPQDLLKQAIAVYFRNCHRQPLWLFESEKYVLEYGSEGVFSAMLALAFCCDSTLRLSEHARSCEIYADVARRRTMMSIVEGKVSISTIQCLCLLSYYNYTGIETFLHSTEHR